MRNFIYQSVVNRLKQIKDSAGEPIIKSYDIWNNNLQHLNLGQAFQLPAILIEFGDIQWMHQGNGVRDAVVTIRLHALQQINAPSINGNSYEQHFFSRFELLTEINRVLHHYFNQDKFFTHCAITSISSITSNDYDEIADDIEIYQCHAQDASILARGKITTQDVKPIINAKGE